jgi:hypothetical protein
VRPADPGRVLRWALLGWGLGHLALGRTSIGAALLASEVVAIGLVAWLTIGLADTSAYLVPFLAGVAFLVAWTWQAVAAYRAARASTAAVGPTPARSPALTAGWLTVPLLLWTAGYWLVAANAASPSAVLDRFVTAWNADDLDPEDWPAGVIAQAEAASERLDDPTARLRDVRLRVDRADDDRATAVAESIHYERRASRFLGIFEGSELVPVADREVLILELAAEPVELPGGGDVGAVRWEIVDASVP